MPYYEGTVPEELQSNVTQRLLLYSTVFLLSKYLTRLGLKRYSERI